jgi:hypothetical protein
VRAKVAFTKRDILTMVTIKPDVLWGVKPCGLVQVYRCFGGMYCFLLQSNHIADCIKTLVAHGTAILLVKRVRSFAGDRNLSDPQLTIT